MKRDLITTISVDVGVTWFSFQFYFHCPRSILSWADYLG